MLRVEKLTEDAFSPFGTFIDPQNLGAPVNDKDDPFLFFADKMIQQFSASNNIAVSPLVVKPRPFIISVTEKHEYTEEVFGGFNQDVCFHVQLDNNGKPDIASTRVFSLPAGSWVRLKRHVWHHAPFVLGENEALGTVLLPPHTFTNDCLVVSLKEQLEVNHQK